MLRAVAPVETDQPRGPSGPPVDPHAESLEVEDAVLRERVRLLLRRGLVAQATVVLNGGVVAAVSWHQVPRAILLAWVGLLSVVAVVRCTLSALLLRRELTTDEARRWARVYTASAAVNGLVWGAATALLWVPHSPTDHLLLVLTIGGMVAGAAIGSASFPAAFAAFAAPSLAVTIARLAAEGDRPHVAMALMLAIFAAAMWTLCRSAAETLSDAVRQRVANERLQERRRAYDRVLAGTEGAIRAVIDNAPDPVIVHAEGRIVRANAAAVRVLGHQGPDELLGLSALDLVYPADRHLVVERLAQLEHGHALGRSSPLRLIRSDGSCVFLEFTAFPLLFEGRSCIVASGHDVTERIGTVHALRAAEERFRLTFEHAPIGIALVGLDGKWLRVNRVFCDILGYTEAELLGLTFQDITHPEDLAPDLALAGQLLAGEIPRYSIPKRYVRKDGALVDVMLHGSIVRDETGAPMHFIAQVEDVTERKRAERDLAHRDRMVSLGTLAAGVAHEVNNPLTYVHVNLELLAERLGDQDPDLRSLVDDVRHGADRVRDIIRGLRTFSRTDSERRTVLDVRHAIDVALRLVANELKHRARTVTDYRDVPPVLADESRLLQVFTNLLLNAAQAIPEGHADRNEVRIVTYADERGHAVVEVLDTGDGIPEANLPRVFEPFFTTKPVGSGTGLGLSVCHGIVTAFGGEIGAENRSEGGARFTVTLPPAPAAGQDPASTPRSP